jgi:aminoglycoside/choline kinase family phosphotransferase/choline kinase
MKALILAAGFGTRLRPTTRWIPKPLFTIAGRPILDLIIEQLQAAGCRAVMINTHHLHDRIAAHVQSRRYGIPVEIRFEPDILGTGGAVKNAADFWDDDPFMVVNSDIVTDIDLRRAYVAHCRSASPVTLVMHDFPQFNTVRVSDDGTVVGFGGGGRCPTGTGGRVLAFTGIQVLDPEILESIPENVFSSIIDAYRRLIAAGRPIHAHIVEGRRWREIGTPAAYVKTVSEVMVSRAFEQLGHAAGLETVERNPLAGDGSDRRWYRLASNTSSLIMVDHGLRTTGGGRTEVDAFVDIGRFLYAVGAPVPRIFNFDKLAGLVILEDLGDENLQAVARRTEDGPHLAKYYGRVIDELIETAIVAGRTFQTVWTYQSAAYDRKLILEKECAYFVEAFLNGYLGWKVTTDDFAAEFERIAQGAVENALQGFMHRDFQSRNILLRGDRFYFIDFQGGRMGPLQYDLASLLIDPYVQLSEDMQRTLLDYAVEQLQKRRTLDIKQFKRGYRYCAVNRNLQILGAFGYLSRVKGKSQFETYIPPAALMLHRNLGRIGDAEFPKLRTLAAQLARAFRRT